jgi:dihydrofolate synthase/folylpolyglutamate synthase
LLYNLGAYEYIVDYVSAMSYLRALERLGMRFRIENTKELLQTLDYEFDEKVVHVGGTNGKGTAATVLAEILQKDGKRVGLYTSPELFDFRERIKVDGEMISEKEFANLTTLIIQEIDDMQDKPTFFEATTALALKHFENEKVDVNVLEAGLGGRLDSTNAIDSKHTIITNVSLEHTQILGDTLEEIAKEKAGLIHEGGVLVTAAEGDAFAVLGQVCRRKNAAMLVAGRD